MSDYDLVIAGGTVVTPADMFRSDIGIADGRIQAIGLGLKGVQTYDANGMLVIQAVRQLTFNQQTQLIKLRGLVRPEDVSPQNQVLSTSITSLELEVVGKGIINDYTYRQNPIVRFLEKILVF